MNQTILTAVLDLIESGISETKIRRFIREEARLGKSRANEIFGEIKNGTYRLPETHVKIDESAGLETGQKYTFNKNTNNYIVFIKSAGKNIVVSKEVHKGLMKSYIGGMPLDEMAVKFGFPASYLKEYKLVFGWNRDGLGITNEDAQELTVDKCAEQLLEEKKFEIIQQFNKKSWHKTQEDALKWQQFEYIKFEPFERALTNWAPAQLKPLKSTLADKNSDKVFSVFLSDLHYGAASRSCYMFNKPHWDTHKTIECVDKFASDITQEVKNRKYKFKKCIINGLGDLIHSLDGKTTRGTELTYDYVAEEQFDYALDSLRVFIERMVELFGECEVHAVGGNHNYETEVVLFRALDMFFRKDDRIKFYHHSSRPSYYVCDSTLVMLDHGADHKERAYVPPKGPKLERHISALLLSIPEIVAQCKSRIFCQGDRHHWENIEYNDFEFFMFGTTLAADQHASVNNLKNRARQSCLVLDSSGVREIIHTYFS